MDDLVKMLFAASYDERLSNGMLYRKAAEALAAAQIDARRYQWLRKVPPAGGMRDWLYMPHTKELDAEIDAQIEAESLLSRV